ncbi:MAG: hypothetical protein MUF14_05745, partial [Hyphomonadaceae bacterium]|nr:hypothetical protein [Hyphomonadaceae bacterium]
MSSSLALAQRTATSARSTMDSMSRQIATGQKVSSVKDDGAAWARANSLRNDASTWDWRASEAQRYLPVADLTATHIEEGLSLQRDALSVLQRAANTAAGSADRRRFQTEWQEIQGRWRGIKTLYDQMTVDYAGIRSQGTPFTEWALRPWENGDTFLDDLTMPEAWWLSWPLGNGPGVNIAMYSQNLAAIDTDFMAATNANFTAAITELQGGAAGIGRTQGSAARIGAAYSGLQNAASIASGMSDRMTAAAGSLTD